MKYLIESRSAASVAAETSQLLLPKGNLGMAAEWLIGEGLLSPLERLHWR